MNFGKKWRLLRGKHNILSGEPQKAVFRAERLTFGGTTLKMTEVQIVEELLFLLRGQLGGGVGSIAQEPYKGDFFKLFTEAYRRGYFEAPASPLLTADSLGDILAERWYTNNEKDNQAKAKLMEPLLSKWREWKYAWDRHPNQA